MFHEERVRDKTVHAVPGYPSLSQYVRVFLIDNEWTKKKLHCSFCGAQGSGVGLWLLGLLLGDLELPRGDTVGVDRDALLLRIEHRPPLNDQHIFCICCKCGFNFAPVLVCEEHRIGGRCSAFGEGNPLGNEGVLGPCPTACVVSQYSRALQTRSLGHKGRVPVYVQWSQRCGRCASEVLHPTHRNVPQAVL